MYPNDEGILGARQVAGLFGGFDKQFTPIEGGYLYYPSAWKGAKLVTVEEYKQLIAAWKRATSVRAMSLIVGAGILGVVLMGFLAGDAANPTWTTMIFPLIWMVGMSAWFLRSSLAPWYLVKNRPYVSEPRPRSEVWRQNRAMQSWPALGLFFVISAKGLFDALQGKEILFPASVATAWWSFMLAAFTLVSVLKFRDRLR